MSPFRPKTTSFLALPSSSLSKAYQQQVLTDDSRRANRLLFMYPASKTHYWFGTCIDERLPLWVGLCS